MRGKIAYALLSAIRPSTRWLAARCLLTVCSMKDTVNDSLLKIWWTCRPCRPEFWEACGWICNSEFTLRDGNGLELGRTLTPGFGHSSARESSPPQVVGHYGFGGVRQTLVIPARRLNPSPGPPDSAHATDALVARTFSRLM